MDQLIFWRIAFPISSTGDETFERITTPVRLVSTKPINEAKPPVKPDCQM